MITKILQGPTKVVFPTGTHLTAGRHHQFNCRRVDVHQTWFCGALVHREEEVVDTIEGFWIGSCDPVWGRDRWALHDREWFLVDENDFTFWDGMTREEWLMEKRIEHIESVFRGEAMGWWTVDEEGNPKANGLKFSIAELTAQNKHLMAHLMHDLGFFPSVGQARKNGWDKPLELGRHELGPRKTRVTVEIVA